MRRAVFVTARTKSTRLPRKVLRRIGNRTLLELVIERVRTARIPDLVVLCTSTSPDDDELVVIADAAGATVFRGDPDDVLARYHAAASAHAVDAFAVTWGDEVLCDPTYLDLVLAQFRVEATEPDYVKITGLPEGTYTYGVRVAALSRVMASKTRTETEVWGAYFEQGDCEVRVLTPDPRHRRPELRLTCDYPEDLALLTEIFRTLYVDRNDFSLDAVLALLDARPDLVTMNAHRQVEYLARIREQTARE